MCVCVCVCVCVCLQQRTCDDEAFIVFQSFSEETRDNELGVDHEPDLLLDESVSRYSSTYEPVCKVHLMEWK